MTSAREHYSELLALTKQYLLQEHALTDRILSEPETYAYFFAYAQKKQEAKGQAPEKPQTHTPSPQQTIASPAFAPRQETAAATKPAPLPPQAKPSSPIPPRIPPSPLAKTTAPIADKTSAPIKENGPFKLEVPSALQPADFNDLKKIVREKLPHLQLVDHLPDDGEAQKLSNSWAQEKKSPQVLILSFDETQKHLAFLMNIAKALEMHGISASVANALKLEQNAKWETTLQAEELKLIVASSSGFYQLQELQKYYKEGTKQGRHYLGDRLLLLLSDISFYLKEPSLKPSLWGALKELLTAASKTS